MRCSSRSCRRRVKSASAGGERLLAVRGPATARAGSGELFPFGFQIRIAIVQRNLKLPLLFLQPLLEVVENRALFVQIRFGILKQGLSGSEFGLLLGEQPLLVFKLGLRDFRGAGEFGALPDQLLPFGFQFRQLLVELGLTEPKFRFLDCGERSKGCVQRVPVRLRVRQQAGGPVPGRRAILCGCRSTAGRCPKRQSVGSPENLPVRPATGQAQPGGRAGRSEAGPFFRVAFRTRNSTGPMMSWSRFFRTAMERGRRYARSDYPGADLSEAPLVVEDEAMVRRPTKSRRRWHSGAEPTVNFPGVTRKG
ncbi:MAG: hypothetical protein U0903_00225 [Planctomycetales bacterium]